MGGVTRTDTGFAVITNIEPYTAIDEYGDEIPGFIFDAQDATDAEIQSWKDARRAARGGRSVLQMMEDADEGYNH